MGIEDTIDMPGALARILDALATSGARHVFIGALPVLAWGRPRGTTVFDLVAYCSPADLERLQSAFELRGIERRHDLPSSDPSDPLPDMVIFRTRESPSIRVDLFVAKLEFEQAVLETGKEATILGSRLLVASRDASIVYNLLAGRTKDTADAESLFEASSTTGTNLDWGFLGQWTAASEITERLAPYRIRYGRPASAD